jgi:hypothetical protein
MPIPLIPLIAFGVTSSLAAMGIKKVLKSRDEAKDLRRNTFNKYALDHRIKEKTAHSLLQLRALKSEIRERELTRFHLIFENVLHSGLNFNHFYFEEPDYAPLVSSAPIAVVDALGSTAEWFKAGISQLQQELQLANKDFQKVVLEHGFDYRNYGTKEIAITQNAFRTAQALSKAIAIALVTEKGDLREEAIDEIEELMLDQQVEEAA